MGIKKAGEVMIPLSQYPHVLYNVSILEAMRKMASTGFDVHGYKSLPRFVLVFNENRELLGMVRRRDFFRGLEPEKLAGMLPPKMRKSSGRYKKPEESQPAADDSQEDRSAYDRFVREALAKSSRPVSDVMSPIHAVADYDEDIVTVILKLVENNLSFIPVIQGGQVVGVVRTVELLYEMCEVLQV